MMTMRNAAHAVSSSGKQPVETPAASRKAAAAAEVIARQQAARMLDELRVEGEALQARVERLLQRVS